MHLRKVIIRKYHPFRSDRTLVNRHIALLFDTYQTITTETAAKGQKLPTNICVPFMKSLAGECIMLYNQIPAVVCVYMGEALQSAGMLDEARNHFKMALPFYPNSILLQLHTYRLEQDTDKQKQLLAPLKESIQNIGWFKTGSPQRWPGLLSQCIIPHFIHNGATFPVEDVYPIATSFMCNHPGTQWSVTQG